MDLFRKKTKTKNRTKDRNRKYGLKIGGGGGRCLGYLQLTKNREFTGTFDVIP